MGFQKTLHHRNTNVSRPTKVLSQKLIISAPCFAGF
jgi:hypothetical protein